MAKKLVNLSLPEWAWLSGGDHERGGDQLEERTVVYHVRSATVIEFFEAENFIPNGNVRSYTFNFTNSFREKERHIAVIHYSAACDDPDTLDKILKAAAEWYCDYLTWEDRNIMGGELASMN